MKLIVEKSVTTIVPEVKKYTLVVEPFVPPYLHDLADVSAANPDVGDQLAWNGTAWQNISPSEGDTPILYQPRGRLTLLSGNAVPAQYLTARETIYYTPYNGDQIPLFDGSNWSIHSFSELSLPLVIAQTGTLTNGAYVVTGLTNTTQFVTGAAVTGTGIQASTFIASIDSATQVTLTKTATASGAQALTFKAQANTNFDVFVYLKSGVLTLEAIPWRNSGQAVTGATNASPIVLTANAHGVQNGDAVYATDFIWGRRDANGVWLAANVAANTLELAGSTATGAYVSGNGWLNARQGTGITLQNGMLLRTGYLTRLYLGTFRTTATAGQCESSPTKRFIWNMYNRLPMFVYGIGTSHTYTTGTWREWNGGTSVYRAEWVIGYPYTQVLTGSYKPAFESSTTSSWTFTGVGLNTITSGNNYATQTFNIPVISTARTSPSFTISIPCNAGYHWLSLMENGSGATGVTFTTMDILTQYVQFEG